MPTKNPTRDYHPARVERAAKLPKKRASKSLERLVLPRKETNLDLDIQGRVVKLTNLGKLFWPELGITKRDLLQYYADVAEFLLPHIADRAMVMKRYPNGAAGDFFFMKRAPKPRPEWIELCHIEHSSGNIIDFPMIQDLPSLMWLINLGCIDLNQWYARCDDVDRPDYLHFDLDPVPGADFGKVTETALLLRQALESLKMPCYAKTTGSKGIHIYVFPAGLAIRERVFSRDCVAGTQADYRGIHCGQATKGKSAGGLQPECMGAHACIHLFNSTAT